MEAKNKRKAPDTESKLEGSESKEKKPKVEQHKPKRVGATPMKPLTLEQQQKVLDAFKGRHRDRNRACFALGIFSGFRISELLSMKVDQLWDGKQVRDECTVSSFNMKGGKLLDKDGNEKQHRAKARHVIINPSLKPILEPILRGRDKEEPVFKSQKKTQDGKLKPLNKSSMWDIYKQAYLAIGLPSRGWGCHSTRKSFCEFIYAHYKGDLIKTQKAMGHARIDSTVRYIETFKNDLVEAFEADRGLKLS